MSIFYNDAIIELGFINGRNFQPVVLLVPEGEEVPLVRIARSPQLSGGAANAGASTQTFNQGGGFGGFPGGFGGFSGSAGKIKKIVIASNCVLQKYFLS